MCVCVCVCVCEHVYCVCEYGHTITPAWRMANGSDRRPIPIVAFSKFTNVSKSLQKRNIYGVSK